MLSEDTVLTNDQRREIAERVRQWITDEKLTQAAVARQLGISAATLSETLHQRYPSKAGDRNLVRCNNWLELAAKRKNILHDRQVVETQVAKDILLVASVVAETGKIGCVFGPAQIGKTFTLRSIEGDQRYGAPVLIRITEGMLRPAPVCRAIAAKFEIKTKGTLDMLLRRVTQRLKGTKRMLIFDEIERVQFSTIETIRDLHDETGCPILLCGKPKVYERLGFREVGGFNEVTDQIAARIAIKCDLTERTRGDKPEPLFSMDDVRALIKHSQLKLKVEKEGVKWLQQRASSLGTGGLGRALTCLFMAEKFAEQLGADSITIAHFEEVENLTMGHEDAEAVAEAIAQSSGMRRVV